MRQGVRHGSQATGQFMLADRGGVVLVWLGQCGGEQPTRDDDRGNGVCPCFFLALAIVAEKVASEFDR